MIEPADWQRLIGWLNLHYWRRGDQLVSVDLKLLSNPQNSGISSLDFYEHATHQWSLLYHPGDNYLGLEEQDVALRMKFNDGGTTQLFSDLEIEKTAPALRLDATTDISHVYFAEAGTDKWFLAYDPSNNRFVITEAGVSDRLLIADGGTFTFTGNFGGWTALPFTNSGGTTWANFGAPWQTGRYRKVGDIVYLEGLVKRTAGSGNIIATLPTGYRPANFHVFPTIASSNTLAVIEVQPDGDIQYNAGGDVSVYLNLSGIYFSTL